MTKRPGGFSESDRPATEISTARLDSSSNEKRAESSGWGLAVFAGMRFVLRFLLGSINGILVIVKLRFQVIEDLLQILTGVALRIKERFPRLLELVAELRSSVLGRSGGQAAPQVLLLLQEFGAS